MPLCLFVSTHETLLNIWNHTVTHFYTHGTFYTRNISVHAAFIPIENISTHEIWLTVKHSYRTRGKMSIMASAIVLLLYWCISCSLHFTLIDINVVYPRQTLWPPAKASLRASMWKENIWIRVLRNSTTIVRWAV